MRALVDDSLPRHRSLPQHYITKHLHRGINKHSSSTSSTHQTYSDINQSTKPNTQTTQAIHQLTTFPYINQQSSAKNHTSNHNDYPNNQHHQPNRRNGSHLARHSPQASPPSSRPGSQAPSSQQVSNGRYKEACLGRGAVAGWPQIHLKDEDVLFSIHSHT